MYTCICALTDVLTKSDPNHNSPYSLDSDRINISIISIIVPVDHIVGGT